MTDKIDRLQVKDIKQVSSGSGGARFYLMVDTENPEMSEAVVEYTVTKRYPITSIQAASDMYTKLTKSGSRYHELEDLV